MSSAVSWSFAVTIVGGLLSLVGTLIVLNLRSIKKCIAGFGDRLTDCEKDVKQINLNMAECKIDCDRSTVSKEDWVRSEGYTRKELKDVAATLNRIDGKLTVVEQIPQVCGNIVREVVKELNGGKHD